ncbi:hypothetical protein IU440_18170 [Nocardia cyriacigeorgica]|uniref:hypothetical protein n=1 Tax=Nocardia cyriacigeorgica TaxID=135487 RepID=UPI0018957F2F|nr:hypothetical protein [Nocardia cyriacigeorgica]MBF6426613.1 hypothetical protein [Nocardia cyriacigeorgica]
MIGDVTDRRLGAWRMPKLFAIAIQAALAGSAGGGLHLAGWMTLAQAATVIATTWVLIAPLPQLISTPSIW